MTVEAGQSDGPCGEDQSPADVTRSLTELEKVMEDKFLLTDRQVIRLQKNVSELRGLFSGLSIRGSSWSPASSDNPAKPDGIAKT
jgi:hypothetical protein